MDCVFCSIVKGDIPSYKVYEDEYVIAFLDINPTTRGHTLVVPKVHVSKMSDMDEEEILNRTVNVLQKIVRAVESTISPDLNIVVNQGAVAGQVIPHFHFHVVPRTPADGVEFVVSKPSFSDKEFEAVRKQVSSAL